MIAKKHFGLLCALLCLTLLFIAAQGIFFAIHYQVSDLLDSATSSGISHGMMHLVILLPIVGFVVIQVVAYGLWLCALWFVSVSVGELLDWSEVAVRWLGIVCWAASCMAILILNFHYYPRSFFSMPFVQYPLLADISHWVLVLNIVFLLCAVLLSYVNVVVYKRHVMMGGLWAVLVFGGGLFIAYDHYSLLPQPLPFAIKDRPNIILIGIDSLRPDFVGYYGNKTIHTPHIDHFLQTGSVFTEAYSPLSRTFPSWVSVFTAKFPKHDNARINLADPAPILKNANLPKLLQSLGYETIQGMDEARFANFTKDYGFDHIVGPKKGVVDFILGGLSDFPVTNLLVNLPFGRYLFPYNYGNRAAAITYEPDHFLRLIQAGLSNRPNKPLFLAIHFCLPHWPATWARDHQPASASLEDQYVSSVERVDAQFGQMLVLLKEQGLLEHSLVVLLSDHGVGLGLQGDMRVNKENYRGPADQLRTMPLTRYSGRDEYSIDFKRDYGINTSYGQGNNVLSRQQYHVVLAMKGYHLKVPVQQIEALSSLIDVAPTILDYLQLPALPKVDGISFKSYLLGQQHKKMPTRPFFMETGDKVSELETDHIVVQKVVKQAIGLYKVNPKTGLLYMDPETVQGVLAGKQRAMMLGDWLLVRYPANVRSKLVAGVMQSTVSKPFYVLMNTKTGLWTVGLSSSFAKSAPVAQLMQQFKSFYGDEV